MQNNTIIMGIAGPSASGKTLLARTIVDELRSDQIIIIGEDSYYKHRPDLSFEERARTNFDHPDAFDHELLFQHLQTLQLGNSVQVPSYDFSLHLRKPETRLVRHHTIIILEGILLLAEAKLREIMDICIFMDTPLDICLARRLSRDIIERKRSIQSVLEQYERTVRPMYFQFIEPSKRYADIIVPRGGENRIAIDMIKAKMRELLNDSSKVDSLSSM
jgi:uridine kinase